MTTEARLAKIESAVAVVQSQITELTEHHMKEIGRKLDSGEFSRNA